MKTVTMRVDDAVYRIIKTAADGQKRNLSNFIEFAVMQYLPIQQPGIRTFLLLSVPALPTQELSYLPALPVEYLSGRPD